MITRLIVWYKQINAKKIKWPATTHDEIVETFLRYSKNLEKLGKVMGMTEYQVFCNIGSHALRERVYSHLSVLERVHITSVKQLLFARQVQKPRIHFISGVLGDDSGWIDLGALLRRIQRGYTTTKRLSDTSVLIHHYDDNDFIGCAIKLSGLNPFYADLLTDFYPKSWWFVDENK